MAEDDLKLLQRFEPVVKFTQGEYFFPVSVERYVANSALWSEPETGEAEIVAHPGGLDLNALARLGATTQGLGQSLSLIRTGGASEKAHIPVKDRPPRLRGGSRLAAVGLVARIVDALNRLSLVFRGRVAGGSAAQSFLLQAKYLEVDKPTYYGRVVREGGWIVCQYWFFYAFNNWRSAFGGVNEHEADWEQVTIYLDGTGAEPEPRWVVFSAHDETGDDLRRRWDDPDLSLVAGEHPVVFAGAGSHSGAYLAGDYLITIETPTLGGLVRVVRWLSSVLAPWSNSNRPGLGIPYLDYARGDGRAIGPGQPEGWNGVLIDEDTGWVRQFRGLWGHDTKDRLGGERGPAGPRYERDGTVRPSWAEPIGWAGMAKVAPNPRVEQEMIAARAVQIDQQLDELEREIDGTRTDLKLAAAGLAPAAPEVKALLGQEELLLSKRMEETRLRDERVRMEAVAIADIPDPGPHAHLKHRRTPIPPQSGVRARVLSWWAVLSTPAILYILGRIVAPDTVGYRVGVAAVGLLLLLLIEGLVRGKLLALLGRLVIVIALLVGLYYLWVDWRIVLSWGLLATAALVLFVNLRDALKR